VLKSRHLAGAQQGPAPGLTRTAVWEPARPCRRDKYTPECPYELSSGSLKTRYRPSALLPLHHVPLGSPGKGRRRLGTAEHLHGPVPDVAHIPPEFHSLRLSQSPGPTLPVTEAAGPIKREWHGEHVPTTALLLLTRSTSSQSPKVTHSLHSPSGPMSLGGGQSSLP